MEVFEVNISELLPFQDNPREISDEGMDSLKKSLLEFGFFAPLVVWREHNHLPWRIVAGNQRYAAYNELTKAGLASRVSIPVVEFKGTIDEAKAIVIRDNQNEGQWDWDKVSALLEGLFECGIDPLLSGFNKDTVEDLTSLALKSEELEDYLNAFDEDSEFDSSRQSQETESNASPVDGFVKARLGKLSGLVDKHLYDRWVSIWNEAPEGAEFEYIIEGIQ